MELQKKYVQHDIIALQKLSALARAMNATDRDLSPETEKLLHAVVHNENEAYEQYCLYAHHIGFTVWKEHSGFWPNSKKLKTKKFICGKAGFKKELKDTITTRFKRADTRTGCPTMIRYFVDLEGNWSVKKFIESHNHPLAEDGDKHLLGSNRKMCDVSVDILRSMTKSGIRTSDAFRFLATEIGTRTRGHELAEKLVLEAFNKLKIDVEAVISGRDQPKKVKIKEEEDTQ
ncbi:protein FAR1-RELATED SEQUENCE 5-like [Phalaenopsis equestris]|uniref:protein FAR1-RELATED SEQUENCE 5-like n=1 Tax=Phalaenopsis equestris TaxID=78828 RepID=UPI0009E2088F|nr:protein FAR1-RELATED SEQUENCE 5-like [Phalaenopsis equestris]